jgi:hypothetical protein
MWTRANPSGSKTSISSCKWGKGLSEKCIWCDTRRPDSYSQPRCWENNCFSARTWPNTLWPRRGSWTCTVTMRSSWNSTSPFRYFSNPDRSPSLHDHWLLWPRGPIERCHP